MYSSRDSKSDMQISSAYQVDEIRKYASFVFAVINWGISYKYEWKMQALTAECYFTNVKKDVEEMERLSMGIFSLFLICEKGNSFVIHRTS